MQHPQCRTAPPRCCMSMVLGARHQYDESKSKLNRNENSDSDCLLSHCNARARLLVISKGISASASLSQKNS